MAEIEVKAMVDEKMTKVIFVESDAVFVDLLFSFLTRPIGNIIKLTRDQPSTAIIGSMNNLYSSAESLDDKYFETSECRSMLLSPRNGAEDLIRKVRPFLEDDSLYHYFVCCNNLSYYKSNCCSCGKIMDLSMSLTENAVKDENGGVFMKGLTKYLISDDLQIVPLSTAATFSLISKHGEKDCRDADIKERTFGIRVNEVLTLLRSSLVSNSPLTETLLKISTDTVQSSFNDYTNQGNAVKLERGMSGSGSEDPSKTSNICVKLLVSKTKNIVCYAEADGDFINLLLSFLTIPLGFISKEMCIRPSKGCSWNLYKSIDPTKHLISFEPIQYLLFPRIAHHFGLKKKVLLDVNESYAKPYYFGRKDVHGGSGFILANRQSLIQYPPKTLTLMDPKQRRGYVKEHAMFTVTENLVITPTSLQTNFSILKKLNVGYSDIEEHIVYVGKDEASRLLVASFISSSPLTDVFISGVP